MIDVPATGSVIVDDATTTWIRHHLDRVGERRAAADLGLSRAVIMRLCARRPVRRGTAALARLRVAELADTVVTHRAETGS